MNVSAIGKALDQPLLICKLKDKTPKILGGAALAFGIYDTFKAPKEERKKRGIKNAIILSAVVGTSLISAFGLKAPSGLNRCGFGEVNGRQILKGLVNVRGKDEILKEQKAVVAKFLKNNEVSSDVKRVLNKAKTGILNVRDTEILLSMEVLSNKAGVQAAQGVSGRNNIGQKTGTIGKKELLETLFSKKEDLSAREIFEETGRLSILGLVPVTAGVLSGITAEKITGESTPKSTLHKIKEGVYQFLANIFMCNVGAAAALFGAERLQKAGIIKSLSPLQKLGVIMGGIFVTGIMGGSVVANLIGKKILDPIFDPKNDKNTERRPAWNPYLADSLNTFASRHKGFENFKMPSGKDFIDFCERENCYKTGNKGHGRELYSERKPELLDMALHTDDIATAGVLSGFKWIEPMLPLMYTISGYRAGIGYRNNCSGQENNHPKTGF